MGRFVRSKARILILTMSVLLSWSCYEGSSIDAGGTEVIVTPPKDNYVCNPLTTSEDSDLPTGVGTQLPESGLMADLYYLTDDQPRYSSVDDLIANGHKVSEISLYFDRLFIPTRPFDRGFITQAGEVIKTPNGDTLYEYFGLHFESKIRLTESDAVGAYQFGILADDGAKLHLDDQGLGYTTHVNNDGVHPTKFKCATSPVFLDRNSAIPMKLDYHQGPRFHVSLVLMWRPWPDSSQVNDPECDQSGNSRYFDYTADPPTPTTTYLNMVNRGWMPLQKGNFKLPYENQNPCEPEEPLAITDISVSDKTQTSAKINWTTNLPASSEVKITRVSNGAQITVPADPALITTHAMGVTGLTADTLYSFEITSTTATGQTLKTDPQTFRTFR